MTKMLFERLDKAYAQSADPDVIQKAISTKGWRRGYDLSQEEWDEIRQGMMVIGHRSGRNFTLCTGMDKKGHYPTHVTAGDMWSTPQDALNSSHWVLPADEYFEGSQP